MKQYPCKESPDGLCEHGGNKAFNHGFVAGTGAFCRHKLQKRFLAAPGFVCPKREEDARAEEQHAMYHETHSSQFFG